MAHLELTGHETRRRSTVGSFLANLPEFLGAMAADPRTIVAVAEFQDHRYWQAWADADTSLIIEVISNLNIRGDILPLSDEEEGILREMGFVEPSLGPNPNWRVESQRGDLVRLVRLTWSAVCEVLRECPQNWVDVRTWEFKRASSYSRDEARETGRVYKSELKAE